MCHIIVIQIVLTAIIIGIFWYAMDYLAQNVSSNLIANVIEMLRGQTLTTELLEAQLAAVTLEQFLPIATGVTAVTLCFGFIMAYVALTPTRRSFDRKKRFVSNIAHELRTPLAIIRTNTDVALLNKEIPSEFKKTLEKNITELERISEIMNNLMSLSNVMRTESMQFKHIDLGKISQNAIDSLSEVGMQKNVTLILRKNTDMHVIGNAAALEQVAFNLIKNAITHTGNGGLITVTVEKVRRGFVDLVVADSGSGIAHDDLFHIFEPFYRSRRSPRGAGSGLGLTIVNEIVQMHRGKISIRSMTDRGTTVTVSIPESIEVSTKQSSTNDSEEISIDFSRTLSE